MESIKTHNSLSGWEHLRFWKYVYPALSEDLFRKDKYHPPYQLWFKPFDLCKPDNVKVVILGTQPYEDHSICNGLAFSTRAATKTLPPSLREIFDEYESDLGLRRPRNGDLSPWAERGTLLLNRSLTYPYRNEWSKLTYEVVRYLSDNKEGIVFILWGEAAQELTAAIDTSRHFIIASTHPGYVKYPGNANTFKGSRPFTTAAGYNPALSVDYWRL